MSTGIIFICAAMLLLAVLIWLEIGEYRRLLQYTAEAKKEPPKPDILTRRAKEALMQPPKPDAARECGIAAPPKFDEPKRKPQPRKGMKKVVVMQKNGAVIAWYNLTDAARVLGIHKHDLSPSDKMDDAARRQHIAKRIADELVAFHVEPDTVKLYRNGHWYFYHAGVDI